MLSTFNNSKNSKPLTNKMLKEMMERLDKMEPPKAMLLMPGLGEVVVYEVEQDIAKKMLSLEPVDKLEETLTLAETLLRSHNKKHGGEK